MPPPPPPQERNSTRSARPHYTHSQPTAPAASKTDPSTHPPVLPPPVLPHSQARPLHRIHSPVRAFPRRDRCRGVRWRGGRALHPAELRGIAIAVAVTIPQMLGVTVAGAEGHGRPRVSRGGCAPLLVIGKEEELKKSRCGKVSVVAEVGLLPFVEESWRRVGSSFPSPASFFLFPVAVVAVVGYAAIPSGKCDDAAGIACKLCARYSSSAAGCLNDTSANEACAPSNDAPGAAYRSKKSSR
ncbi:hypothetical protein VC83_08481 [Pseudogymnoascus destructans]|uniref:Uncharacterized protein n=1 Tax=Pseudogymnoascus destructans TaxID=655981 RepID=A0A177A0L4_9PEZI|nr:uncharacterized protein VC83_08481 [Pseudogymnoascus destructans]OAF55120.1 hypothetical protein VC83_08481 [Pseudogymnoascus destructans]